MIMGKDWFRGERTKYFDGENGFWWRIWQGFGIKTGETRKDFRFFFIENNWFSEKMIVGKDWFRREKMFWGKSWSSFKTETGF